MYQNLNGKNALMEEYIAGDGLDGQPSNSMLLTSANATVIPRKGMVGDISTIGQNNKNFFS